MDTYICFNDESGSIYDKETDFYVRASIIVNSTQLINIENKIKEIKSNKNLKDLSLEIKWQDLWQLRNYFRKNKKTKNKILLEVYDYLKSHNQDYHLLINYCEDVLSIIKGYDLKIILSFTIVNKYPQHKPESLINFIFKTIYRDYKCSLMALRF